MQSEARVINVSPHVARFQIATTPGSQPRRYKLGPGESIHIQIGYTQSFQGAGRQPVRATIESLTEREVWNKGPTLPMVVHESRAAEMRSRWQEMIARGAEPPKPMDVYLPSADGGEPVKMTVQPAAAVTPAQVAAASSRLPAFDDDEDQSAAALDEPPPDHNEPLEAVTVPAAPVPTKAESKGKGR
ncbi:MAG TPA: hypothetical protein VMZ53_03810 [Kofleriaceae bacterium]|nr:hypothetical protein [Kofleriaceae bacterium]